jgi:hypothetical protein
MGRRLPVRLPESGAPVKRWLWVGGAALLVVAAVVLFWFQPQKLWIDDKVDDTVPVGITPTSAPNDQTASSIQPASATPVDLVKGTFISRDHTTSGAVRILDLGDGRRIVRLEGLKTDNGPDLYLYLTPHPAKGEEQAFDDGHLSLGRLKGNLGDQNYDVPAGADLTKYRSVVIWCDRFNAAFGAADLA